MKLQSSEGHLFEIDFQKLIAKSIYIESFYADRKDETDIDEIFPLPLINSNILTKIIDLINCTDDRQYQCEVDADLFNALSYLGCVDLLNQLPIDKIYKLDLSKIDDINIVIKILEFKNFNTKEFFIRYGDKNIVTNVINSNNVNEQICDQTPLTLAIDLESLDLVKCFLSIGADVNQESPLGVLPLNLAIERKNKKIVNEILKYNVKINNIDDNGLCAIHKCAIESYPMDRILEHDDVDVNIESDSCYTPLMYCCMSGDIYNIILLLQQNNIDYERKYGALTTEDLARKSEKFIIWRLFKFKRSGEDMSFQNLLRKI